MKKYKNRLLTLLVLLLTQAIAFAQPKDFGKPSDIYPGADNLDESVDQTPIPLPPPLPIDSNQWLLLSAGLLYGYAIYKTRSKPNS
jgi:hypothetical protein